MILLDKVRITVALLQFYAKYICGQIQIILNINNIILTTI